MNMPNALFHGAVIGDSPNCAVFPAEAMIVVQSSSKIGSDADNIPVVGQFSGCSGSRQIDLPQN